MPQTLESPDVATSVRVGRNKISGSLILVAFGCFGWALWLALSGTRAAHGLEIEQPRRSMVGRPAGDPETFYFEIRNPTSREIRIIGVSAKQKDKAYASSFC